MPTLVPAIGFFIKCSREQSIKAVPEACSFDPLPPLINGTDAALAARGAESSSGCRKTMQSANPLYSRIVSSKVSPFSMDKPCSPVTPIQPPPALTMPDWKEFMVLVDG